MTVLHSLYRFFDKTVLPTLFPPFCRGCSVSLSYSSIFCVGCFTDIKPIASTSIAITASKRLKVVAISAYQQPLKGLISRKFSKDVVAFSELAKIALHKMDLKALNIDLIVPIPLHWTRKFKRGFNQAEVMAQMIGKELGIGVADVLRRNRATSYQSHIPLPLRAGNVEGAFVLSKRSRELLQGKNLLLVDDLSTTGSTLKFAAKALLEGAPKSVSALVACRAC